MFDNKLYNQLPSVAAATATFASELASSGLAIESLLDKLRPLFDSDEYKGKYGIWLLHHHFDLQDGERMVKKGLTSQPTTDQASNIVTERWGRDGEELEHVYADDMEDLPSPPSSDFIRQFQEIVGAYDIDCLGICSAPSPDELKQINAGYTLVERCEEGRKQILTTIPANDPSMNNVFKTSWYMISGVGFSCTHVCPTRF